jgi:hypothetical protein
LAPEVGDAADPAGLSHHRKDAGALRDGDRSQTLIGRAVLGCP